MCTMDCARFSLVPTGSGNKARHNSTAIMISILCRYWKKCDGSPHSICLGYEAEIGDSNTDTVLTA